MSELNAFTPDQVCTLTGLSRAQLRYWDRTEFFSPTLLDEPGFRTFGRIYSFRDLVGLRAIGILRKQHSIPLQELRRVGEWLQAKHEYPWSSLRFALKGRQVVFVDPDSGLPTEPSGAGQTVLPIALEIIANEMRQASERLRERTPEQYGRVVRNRYVVRNAWVISGTRIPTTAIWNYHSAGFSAAQIVHEYPRLTEEDVRAAIDFEAARQRVA